MMFFRWFFLLNKVVGQFSATISMKNCLDVQKILSPCNKVFLVFVGMCRSGSLLQVIIHFLCEFISHHLNKIISEKWNQKYWGNYASVIDSDKSKEIFVCTAIVWQSYT